MDVSLPEEVDARSLVPLDGVIGIKRRMAIRDSRIALHVRDGQSLVLIVSQTARDQVAASEPLCPATIMLRAVQHSVHLERFINYRKEDAVWEAICQDAADVAVCPDNSKQVGIARGTLRGKDNLVDQCVTEAR